MSEHSLPWRDEGDDVIRVTHDEGDFDGAIITEAQVNLGGNGRWSAAVWRLEKQRMKRIGHGRIRPKTLECHCPPQFQTKPEAVEWAELMWHKITTPPVKESMTVQKL